MIEDFAWTIPTEAPIVPRGNPTLLTSPDVYLLDVESTVALDRNVYGVTLECTATYYTTGEEFTSLVTFDVEVVDPCVDNSLVPFSITAIAVEAGLVDETTFTEPEDNAAITLNEPTLCGTRSYEVVEVIGGNEVAQNIVVYSEVVAGTTHKLTTTTQFEDIDVGVHDMRLKVTLPDELYPSLNVDFTVEILDPVCDCTLLEWVPPEP